MDDNKDFQRGVKGLMAHGIEGNAKLIDMYSQPLDFDGKEFGKDLAFYKYEMEGLVHSVDVMVKKGKVVTGEITAESYKLISNVKHETLIPLENYIPIGNGWVVFPPMNGTLTGFMGTLRAAEMFQGNDAKKQMSPYLRAMIM